MNESQMKQPLPERLLRAYKRWLSPMLPARCRFVPTCSEYAAEACARYGFFRGSLLAAARLLRCHPFAHGGHDPIPVRHPSRRENFRSTHSHHQLGAGSQ